MFDTTKAILGTGAVALFAIIVTISAQNRTDEWRVRQTSDASTVQFTVQRYKGTSHWSNSQPVPLTRLKGLKREQLNGSGPAKFEYVSDAGRLLCEGQISGGRGGGRYQWVASPEYSAELVRMGYDAPTEEQQFGMMMANVELAFARSMKETGVAGSIKTLTEMAVQGVSAEFVKEVRDIGYRDLTASNFVELKIHGVTAPYLRDMKAAGYDVGARQMVEFKIHGVSPEYFRELQAFGLRPGAKELVEYKIHGVSAEFLKALKEAGYGNLEGREVVEMKIHGVSPEYVAQLKTYGLQPARRDIVQMKIQGVTPDYLKGLRDAGLGSLSANEVTDLKIQGVSSEFAVEAKQLGYAFTARDLMDLKINGVTSDYLRKLKDSGMKNLSARQITQMKIHGVI